MAGWTLAVWAAVAILFAPFSSWILGWRVFQGEGGVVGNLDLLSWLATPAGAAFGLVAGALAMTGGVVRYAGLYYIVVDDLEGIPAGLRRTALGLVPRLPALFRLCMLAVAAGMLLLLPLLVGLLAVWWVFLGAHDINYYLVLQPPEWRWALAVGGIWCAMWAPAAGYVAGRGCLALPAYLDGHRPLRAALRRAWAITSGRGRVLLQMLASALVLWLLARLAVAAGFLWAAALVIEGIAGRVPSLELLALAVAAYLVGAFALDAIVGFLGFSFVATVLTKFYYVDTELHAAAAPPPSLLGFSRKARVTLVAWLRPARLAPILAILLMGSLAVSGYLLERVPEPAPIVIHAHRAGPPPAPENTLAALEGAIEQGADYSEIDVQRTRDGVVVVLHDADLMRMAGDRRRVADADYPAMVDLVLRPDDGSPDGERRVATLEEFLERARGRIGLNIELKYYGWDPLLAAEVVRLVREHGMESDVVIMSLELAAIRQVQELAPGIVTGFLATVAVGELSALPVDFLAVPTPRATSHLLRRAREQGIEVLVWTVNDPAVMAELIQSGVDGLITDQPALAARVSRELAEMPTAGRLLLRVRGGWERRRIPRDPEPRSTSIPNVRTPSRVGFGRGRTARLDPGRFTAMGFPPSHLPGRLP